MCRPAPSGRGRLDLRPLFRPDGACFGGRHGSGRQAEEVTLLQGGNGKTATTSAAPVYVLGHNDNETRRLMRQSELLNPFTRRLFAEAGITAGMRVLDVGTGAGDVALLAAEIVGSHGSVVGIDRDPEVLARARERANAAGLSNVRFMEGDLHAIVAHGDFDAVVGRLVLLYSPDPAGALCGLSRQLRPGGLAVFQEWHLTLTPLQCSPPLPLWNQVWLWILATMQGAGVNLEIGYGLHRAFQAAGLPIPRLQTSAPLIRGADRAPYEWVAETLRSMLPLTEKLGIATAEEIGIETLAERLRTQTLAADAVVKAADLVGGWARTPAA
jgi:SAM-dependent methyltransferase